MLKVLFFRDELEKLSDMSRYLADKQDFLALFISIYVFRLTKVRKFQTFYGTVSHKSVYFLFQKLHIFKWIWNYFSEFTWTCLLLPPSTHISGIVKRNDSVFQCLLLVSWWGIWELFMSGRLCANGCTKSMPCRDGLNSEQDPAAAECSLCKQIQGHLDLFSAHGCIQMKGWPKHIQKHFLNL